MKIPKLISYSAAILVAGALVVGAVYLRNQRAVQHAQVAPPVVAPWALHSAKVQRKTVMSGFLALATKKADSEVVVTPQISGTIIAMGLREGQVFQPGTVLARIDGSQIGDQISALKADLDAAIQQEYFQKKELERQQSLLAEGFATQENADNARTTYIAAQKKAAALGHQLSQLKTRRSYTVIVADKSGTVAERLAEPGNFAITGKPIYRLSVSGKTRFSIKVPQAVLSKLQIGSEVIMTSGGKTFNARLTRINQTLDTLSMGSVEVDLASSPFRLPAGARVPVRVITRKIKDALSVPVTAIAWSADGISGFVVRASGNGNKVFLKKVPVKIIESGPLGVAIKADIQPNDRIIVAQQSVLLKLKNGDQAILAQGLVQ